MSGTFVLVGTLRTHGGRRRLAGAAGRRGVRPGPRAMSACWASPMSPPAGMWRATSDVQLTPPSCWPIPPWSRPSSAGLARMNAEGKGSSMQVKPRAADGRAAVGRRPRDHRQGLYQPARHAGAPQGAGGQALRRRRGRDRHSVPRYSSTRAFPDAPRALEHRLQRIHHEADARQVGVDGAAGADDRVGELEAAAFHAAASKAPTCGLPRSAL